MDIQSSALNELFALYSIIVQGWISPVRPVNTADGGIPKSLYDDQLKGLECLVDPWVELNQAVAGDDRVDLFINNGVTPVDGKTISPGEENLRVRLYVPKGRLRDGVNEIYYRVTRASGNGSEDSRKLRVLYHLWAPGEPAPDAIRLLTPDDVVANGVSPELAERGVNFGLEYDNRRPYDLISLTLGSRGLVERELTPEEGDSDLPPVQTLFTNTFKQNPDNPRTPVFFSVTDQLGNFNLSATQYIDVHVNLVMLMPPDLSENPDDSSDDPSTIDLSKVKDFLYVLVHVFSPLWADGDTIQASYICTPKTGLAVTHSVEASVGRLPFNHKLQVPVAKVLPEGKVSVTFKQVRGGKVIGDSKVAEAQVVGKGVPALTIDVSNLILNGKNYLTAAFNWIRTAPFPGSTAQRVPSGGRPPYRYLSSDPRVAVVDIGTGVVSSMSNGTARITVTDSSPQPQSKFYDVYTSNVYHLLVNHSLLTTEEAAAWILSVGGLRLDPSDHSFLSNSYVPGSSITRHTGGRGSDHWGTYPNHPLVFIEQVQNFNQGVSLEKDAKFSAICRKLA